MAMTEIVKIREKNQIVIPATLRKVLHCGIGDLLEGRVAHGVIILRPVKTHPKDQEWFWSKSWQEKEKEAQADIDTGRMKKFKNAKELIQDLHK